MGIEQGEEQPKLNTTTENPNEILSGLIKNPDIPDDTRTLLEKATMLPDNEKQELLSKILPLLPGAIANAKGEIAQINNALAKSFQALLDPSSGKVEINDVW